MENSPEFVGWRSGRPVQLVERLRIGPRGCVRKTVMVCRSSREEIKQKAPVGGKRGLVTGFSSASRRRMMIETAFLPSCGEVVFLTLTFGREILAASEVKREFKKWRETITRRFPWFSALWRAEMQKRGQGHYHLLCYGLDLRGVQEARRVWLRLGEKRSWDGSNRDAFEARSVDAEWLTTANGVVAYISKYVAKETRCGETDFPGRCWGWVGKKARQTQIRYETVDSGSFFDSVREFEPDIDLAINPPPVFFGDCSQILDNIERIQCNGIFHEGRRHESSERGQGLFRFDVLGGQSLTVCPGKVDSRCDRESRGSDPGRDRLRQGFQTLFPFPALPGPLRVG